MSFIKSKNEFSNLTTEVLKRGQTKISSPVGEGANKKKLSSLEPAADQLIESADGTGELGFPPCSARS